VARYKFDEIAINSTEKKKPVEEDKYTYLGLDHLDSGTLKVSRFGSDVAPIGEKLIMRKGDVLFGKRRAYQKKVAIAPFDGIFSAHGMVLRPRTDVICPKLFPFFVSSNHFLDEAIKISVGSLSPTINWRDLKGLEFNIPPIEKQDVLADELWAMEETKEAYNQLLIATDALVKSQFIEMFGDPDSNPKGWDIVNLSEIADCFIGLTYKPENVSNTGTIVLRSSNIQNSKLDLGDIVRVNIAVKERLMVNNGDILMCSRNGSASLVGKVAFISNLPEEMAFGAFMTIIRSKYNKYLLTFFESDYFRSQIAGGSTTTINQVTKSMLDKITLPLPSLELQNQFAAFVEQVDKSKFDNMQCIISKQIPSSLVNKYNYTEVH